MICLLYYHVFLILSVFQPSREKLWLCWAFFRMPYCLSLNESWYWNFLVNSSILKVRDLVQSPILQMREKRPQEGLWFAWDHEARLRASESRVSGTGSVPAALSVLANVSLQTLGTVRFGLGEVSWLFPLHCISVSPVYVVSTWNIVLPDSTRMDTHYFWVDFWKLLQRPGGGRCFLCRVPLEASSPTGTRGMELFLDWAGTWG